MAVEEMSKNKVKAAKIVLAHMNAGRWSTAEANLLDALRLFPNDFGFLKLMGAAKLRQNQTQEAIQWFKKAANLAPRNSDILLDLGKAELLNKEAEVAAKTLKKTVKLDPKFAQGWHMLAKSLEVQGQAEPALDAYRKTLALRPDSVVAAADLLVALERFDQFDEMIKTLSAIAEIAPEHPVTKTFQGIVWFRQGDIEKARELLDSVSLLGEGGAEPQPLDAMRTQYLAKCDAALGSIN